MLKDERIRVIVKAKGEDDSLAQIIETAIQEESKLRSQRYRNPQQNPQWYPKNLPVKQERVGRNYPGGSQESPIKREVMATSALRNCYPHFPKGRAITLKNYRLAEARKEVVEKQVNQMLEDGIIVPSKSERNFPLIVVPKKLDPPSKRNGVVVLILES
jgi:hypothetical protein